MTGDSMSMRRCGFVALMIASGCMAGCPEAPVVCPEGTTPVGGECVPDDAGTPDTGSPDGGSTDAPTDVGALDTPADVAASDSCVPGPDDPDPMFRDTNCDGIDGDATSSLFVSAAAPTGGDGTRAAPFQTIGEALAVASSGDDVLVAVGSYNETIEVVAGVDVFGGYDPSTWARSSTHPVVVGAASAPAMIASDIGVATRIAALDLESADALESGASSVAARLVRSSAVTLEDVELRAGDGAAAADAVRPGASTAAVDGWNGAGGGRSGVCSLPVTTEPITARGGVGCGCGGAGGWGGRVDGLWGGLTDVRPPTRGDPGALPTECLSTRTGAAGGAPGGPGAAGRTGDPGPAGTAGLDATAASAPVGAFGEAGYAPPVAASGGDGGAGVGGGGGGAGLGCWIDDPFCHSSGGGGGGGGGGGCGGRGAPGASGGGASIGLYLWESSPVLLRVTIAAADGGGGGAGADGGAPGPGGAGGTGGAFFGMCMSGGGTPSRGGAGGRGGDGGTGGASAGGTGGPSIGILLGAGSAQGTGSSGVTITTGAGGPRGVGGPGAVSGEIGLVQPTYAP